MTYTKIDWNDLYIKVFLSSFYVQDGIAEFHATMELDEPYEKAEDQFRLLEKGVQRLMGIPELKDTVLVWKRFFVSDAINQSPFLMPSFGEAVSVIQQPPLNSGKASLLLYFVEKAQVSRIEDGSVVLQRPHYKHIYHTQLHERHGNVQEQTEKIFDTYIENLKNQSCTLERNCIRTWIFVQDVDVQYAGMVTARKDFFEREGLTQQTHYIASTGIEGRYIYPEVLMLMDTYAIGNIDPAQIKFLQAPTHLNPTYEYGVTFERGTSVDYGDRRHVFISGTASIDNEGEVVHPMDVRKQTERTMENIQALLSEAEVTMQQIAHMIVYLRDIADYAVVKDYMYHYYPDIPKVMVWAPVCRPGWLIEVECMAIKAISSPELAVF
ncbi:MAG: hypothetical protein LBQ60_05100 [Bacteroidales bacterium]|jgi:enamine deaminase RidA (YjgF/YER057c/UK114 family)|nr:hypothetical protein [Bacteroidales bacterium]